MSNSNTHCVMPHIGMAIQNNSDFCCCNVNRESWKNSQHEVMFIHKHGIKNSFRSYTRKIIAASLDKGIKHSSCQHCWNLEDSGADSPRNYFNKMFADLPVLPDQPQVLIIKPGNTCNFACRMCNPVTSTSWYSDAFELSDKQHSFHEFTKQFEVIRNSFDKDRELWQQLKIWIAEFKYIDIYGGEPFLTPALFDLLQHAVDSGYSYNISLNIHTNCSIFNQKYLEILTKFKKVSFHVSFDSHISQQLSYIRHKINVHETFQNAAKFIDYFKDYNNVSCSCTCTITPYNIFNIDEILDNLNQILNIPVTENIVTTDEFDIRHLPIPVKKQLMQNIKNPVIKNFLQQTIPGCDIHWPRFCEITDKLDTIRKQSFSAMCPDWYKILKPYWVNAKNNLVEVEGIEPPITSV